MPQDIGVRFEFPFANCTFWGWLPLKKEDEIVVQEGDLSLTVQFTKRGGFLPPEQVVRVSEQNNSFSTITAAVTVRDVPDELVAEIHQRASARNATSNSPRCLAERVLKFVIARINRMISYARNIKGQYWLSEIQYDRDNLHTALTRYKSQVKVGDSNWIQWNPTSTEITFNDGRRVDPTWCIQRSDWAGMKEFVASSTKPPLVSHLLAEAEWHADQGNFRVALTEGVAALESAVHDFADTPLASQCFGSLRSDRVSVESFPRLVDKLGLRGTVAVLFPIIFPEAVLPADLLADCISAVDSRGTVVHHGQRSLVKTTVQRQVAAVRKMCVLLKSRQEQSSEA